MNREDDRFVERVERLDDARQRAGSSVFSLRCTVASRYDFGRSRAWSRISALSAGTARVAQFSTSSITSPTRCTSRVMPSAARFRTAVSLGQSSRSDR